MTNLNNKNNNQPNINDRSLSVCEHPLKKTIEDEGATQENVDTINETTDNIVSSSDLKAYSTDAMLAVNNRSVSSTKIIIIGIVCALLLSAIIVFLLKVTGVLSAITERLDPIVSATPVLTTEPAIEVAEIEDSTTIATDSDSIDVEDPEGLAMQSTDNNDQQSLNQNTALNSDNRTNNTSAINTVAIKQTRVEIEPVAPTITVIKNDSSITSISYEEFREEAQDTLYRESKE